MSEWWTYSLHDFLLFSPRTYYRLIEIYNAELWPAQIIGWLLNAAVVVIMWRAHARARMTGSRKAEAVTRAPRGRVAHAMVLLLLSVAWTWSGWSWLWQRYATINWAATYMAAAFALEVVLLVAFAVATSFMMTEPVHGSPSEERTRNASSLFPRPMEGPRTRMALPIGYLLLIVSLAYPVVALVDGRSVKMSEVFAVMPDPTAMATLGALIALPVRGRGLLGLIPLLWCVVSAATLWSMKSPEVLILSATLILVLVAWASAPRERQP